MQTLVSVWICVYVGRRREREELAEITNVTDNLIVWNCREMIRGKRTGRYLWTGDIRAVRQLFLSRAQTKDVIKQLLSISVWK